MAKTKLTDKLAEDIITAIENGANFKDAAIYNGITEQTFYNWLNKGKKAKGGKFKEFYERMEEAKIKNKIFHITNINKAGKKDWKASAWRLERMYPEEYAKPEIQNNIQIENKNKINSNNNYNKKLDDIMDKAIEEIGEEE